MCLSKHVCARECVCAHMHVCAGVLGGHVCVVGMLCGGAHTSLSVCARVRVCTCVGTHTGMLALLCLHVCVATVCPCVRMHGDMCACVCVHVFPCVCVPAWGGTHWG